MNALRRIRRFLSGPVHVWYHPAFRLPLAQAVGAPMNPRRADDALTWALDAGVIHHDRVHEAPELGWDDAGLVHDAAYLESLDQPGVVARILGAEPDRVPVRSILETWRRGAGGTVEAAGHVARHGGRAVNLLGGFHHAEPAKGGGFCAIDDVAVAIVKLRRGGFAGRVAVIDLDAHPPDGLVACLGDDADVDVLSLSSESAWTVPAASAARVVDARVPTGTTDEGYLSALDRLLGELSTPSGGYALAVYLAGGDPLVGDRLGGLAVSEQGLRTRDRAVLGRLGRTPTVIVPAGGYSDPSWRVLAGTLAEAAGRRTVIRPDYDPLRRRTRDVMRALEPTDLSGGALLTEADVLESLGVPGAAADARFLGYYTRHGLEHALTAYGFLETLRRLGFSDLRVDVEVGRGPDRMRITAPIRGQREVLVDLSVSVRSVDRFRVMFVEWLELRDPRVPFTPDRPRLPGQQQPGLGLAEETGQLLVRAAERVGLQGVAFVPAHWHVAWMSRGRFVVVDPEARGRVRAIGKRTATLPLLEATRRLDGAGLPVEEGAPVRWVPVEVVAPLDPDLAAWLADGEADAERAERRLTDQFV